MPKPSITLLILTLNEIVGVQAILPEIDRGLFSQILVVDGGSNDGTQAWCNENGFEVFTQKRRGVRYAYFDVWPHVTGDYVVTISPDGNCDVSKLPELIELMLDCDLVIGSRYTQGSSSEDDDIVTAFGNWMFNFVAHVFFKSNIKDVMVIYRGYRKNLVSELDLFNEKNYRLPEKIFFTRISWEPLMSIRAVKSGKNVREFSAGEPARIRRGEKTSNFSLGCCIYVPVREGASYLVRVLLFGKGHLGMGFLSDRNFMDSNEVIVIHRNNLDEYADNPRHLNKIDLAVLAIGESGGVAFNIENGHSLFKKNEDLNSKIFRIVSTLGCRTINLVPSCVYPVSNFGVKSKETDLFKGQPEVTSLEYAYSQLNRIETLNETIDQSLLKHVVLTNIFGSSKSEKKNSHFFDHLTQAIDVSKNNRVVLKGSADAVRDFLYNKEISGIAHFLITNWNSIDSVTNFAGYGSSRITDIANEFLKMLNLHLDIHFDNPELMGSKYKVLDDSKARLLGWEPRYSFKDAILDWHQRRIETNFP